MVEETYRRRQPHSPGPRQGSQERWLLHPQSNHRGDHHESSYLLTALLLLLIIS